MNSPVIFSNTGSIIPGGVYTPDAQSLQNSFSREPVFIEEIRFLCSRLMTLNASTLAAVGPVVRVKIDSGRFCLTDGFVPLPILGQRCAAREIFYGQSVNSSTFVYNYYRWRFPRPFPLDVGQSLLPTYLWTAPDGGTVSQAGANSINITTTLVGHTIKNMPKTFHVPYVSSYLSVPGKTSSTDKDLRNSLSTRVNIHRITSRYYAKPEGGFVDSFVEPNDFTALSPLETFAFQMRLTDRFGHSILPQSTPLGLFTPAELGVWNINRVLSPRENFFVQWDANSAPYSLVPNSGFPFRFVPILGLIGDREEVSQ